MDNVNNRSLFRNRSGAAREKVRQMGRVQEPQGILSCVPRAYAGCVRRSVLPMMQPQQMQPQQPMMQRRNLPMMQPQQMPMPAMQQPMMQPQQPVRFQDGGPVEPSFAERFGQNTMASLEMMGEAFLPTSSVGPVDIATAPTPRAPVKVPSVSDMIRQNIGDNPEAQEAFAQLEGTLMDPKADAEARKKAITDAAGAENTKDGLRDVVTKVTGREPPASATVDELNNAISGVALGGAIGGPRSAAARISEALLLGLQAKRETAAGRERFGQELAVAAAKAKKGDGPKGFLDTARGEGALEIFSKLMSPGNKTADEAYAEIAAIDPNLAAELKAALAGAPAAAPARKELTDLQARQPRCTHWVGRLWLGGRRNWATLPRVIGEPHG
jgi:hypothetical protein